MLHYVLAAALLIRCSTVLLSSIATHLPSHLILHYFSPFHWLRHIVTTQFIRVRVCISIHYIVHSSPE